MSIKVTQCCSSSSQNPRFDAGVGDTVLVRKEDSTLYEATIKSIVSKDEIVISSLFEDVEKTIDIESVRALMLDD